MCTTDPIADRRVPRAAPRRLARARPAGVRLERLRDDVAKPPIARRTAAPRRHVLGADADRRAALGTADITLVVDETAAGFSGCTLRRCAAVTESTFRLDDRWRPRWLRARAAHGPGERVPGIPAEDSRGRSRATSPPQGPDRLPGAAEAGP
jgi:hypothetical protein